MYYVNTVIRAIAYLATAVVVAIFLLSINDIKEDYLSYTVNPSVLKLTPPTNLFSGGTGFVVRAPSGKRYTLTNAHVCRIATNGILLARGEGDYAMAYISVIEISNTSDLCVLSPVPGIKGLSISSDQGFGDELSVVGHPHLEPTTISHGYITNHQHTMLVISNEASRIECELDMGGKYEDLSDNPFAQALGVAGRCLKIYDSMRTNAVAYPGNSGSPVVNMYGNVVGVLFAGNSADNYGYIVTLNDLNMFLMDK